MTDIVRPNHEDDLFCHVGGMVRDALEILRDPDHAQPGRNVIGVLGHVRRHGSDGGRAKSVDCIVAGKNLACICVVPSHEGVEGTMQHVERRARHRSEWTADEVLCIAVISGGSLADVDRFIADALEIRDEPKRCCKQAEVIGHRLSQRENAQDERVGFKLITVDLSVECLYVCGDLGSSSAETFEREPDGLFAAGTHGEQVGVKVAKLRLEVSTAMDRCTPAHTTRVTPIAVGSHIAHTYFASDPSPA
jgi:hypothetical protein